MIDIAKVYRRHDCAKPFNAFFNTKGYKHCRDYLVSNGTPTSDIRRRTPASRGTPAVVLVHPLIALEFVRWIDSEMYYTAVEKLMNKPSGESHESSE